MANRKIYVLNAWVVDANGAWHQYDGTPRTFDSRNYNDDPNVALKRAEGAYHEIVGAMCKIDTRKVQTVVLTAEDGFMPIAPFSCGTLAEQEPEPEPEE